MEARLAIRPDASPLAQRLAGSAIGARCAPSISNSGRRSGLDDKASWRTRIPGAAKGGGAGRRRAHGPRREKSAVMVMSLRRRMFGWNVPDSAPPHRIAAGGMKNSGLTRAWCAHALPSASGADSANRNILSHSGNSLSDVAEAGRARPTTLPHPHPRPKIICNDIPLILLIRKLHKHAHRRAYSSHYRTCLLISETNGHFGRT